MKKPLDCPICGVLITPDVDGKATTPHDQEKHDRRKLEDAAALAMPVSRERQRERMAKPGLYDPPGDPRLNPYLRALIERRPDLEAELIAEYEKGLAGELLTDATTPQLPLPLPKGDNQELQPPRRAAGQDDDD